MDLLQDSSDVDKYLDVDSTLLLENLNSKMNSRFTDLNRALVRLIDEFNIVNFIPLNINNEDSIQYLLSHIDNAVQYGEDLEIKEPAYETNEESFD